MDGLLLKQLQSDLSIKLQKVTSFEETEKSSVLLDNYGNIVGLSFVNLQKFPNGIHQMRFLTELRIIDSEIPDLWSELVKINQLLKLTLSNNKLRFIPETISCLTKLTSLKLDNNLISELPTDVKMLHNLVFLDLKQNSFSRIPDEIFSLKNIQYLNLSFNELTFVPPEISYLENLSHLDLSKNNITSFSHEFELLQKLEYLNLNNNSLGTLPKCITKLKNLKNLYLVDNNISDLKDINQLVNLDSLNLSGNKLGVLTEEMASLQNLETLWIYNMNLCELPSFLLQFRKLKHLGIGSNLFSEIPDVVFELDNLEELQYCRNKLKRIPVEISKLKKLRKLWLHRNEINYVPPEIAELKNLHTLSLEDNRITSLPSEIVSLNLEITSLSFSKGINLDNNPLENPPIEIVKQGMEAIRLYFQSLTGNKRLLNEVKILLVGDGSAGKTSLVKQLTGESFDENEAQTHGINIKLLELNANNRKIRVNLWDFGGQEIMHATHQFFLSKRSLYILVLDGRKDEKTEYWLKHIESFGGSSPIFLVINKIDQNPAFDVNRKFLKEKYPSIKGFFKVSCRKGDGIGELVQNLSQQLTKIEMLKTMWPMTWFNVKTKLENMSHDFISHEEYVNICKRQKIYDTQSQNTLLEFLNDLGVMLHFKDLALKDTSIINPEWATEAVYKIINSKELAEKRGILNLKLLDTILDKQIYPRHKHNYIIELMKKFELCYSVDIKSILIPDLLGIEEPTFKFEYNNSLRFVIKYDFLPKSIIPRFIVNMNKDIKGKLRWRTGVVLSSKSYGSSAIIKADEEDKKIYIWVSGQQKRDYFSVIRHVLNNINQSFKKIRATEMVPIPDDENILIEYSELIGFERMGIDEYIIGKLGKRYSIKMLLDGLESRGERTNEKVSQLLEQGININLSQINTQSVTQNQQNYQSNHNNIDIKVELPTIQEEFEKLKNLITSLDPEVGKPLKEIGDCLDEVSAGSSQEQLNKPLNKLSRFLQKLGDNNSEYGKLIAGTKEGVKVAQKLGQTYNKFAQWLALPQVPDIFLGK